MNIGIVTSYIIAGMILMSILMMNISLSRSSTELTFTEIKREHMKAIQEIMISDIQKMGYNRYEKVDPIFATAETQKISFFSNIDNSSDESVEQITWEFLPSSAVTSTENPNDYELHRTVDGVTGELNMGVSRFNIRYYDTYGAPKSDSMATPIASSDFENIRQIELIIELQSPERIMVNTSGGGHYVRTTWQKRFSPPNLEQQF